MKKDDIVNELQDTIHGKCERAWIQYYQDTCDIVLEYKLKVIGRNPLFGDKRGKTRWVVFEKE